jgi:gamma-glutamylcysteine synthetase
MTLRKDRLNRDNRIQSNMNHQDFNWKQITNKYRNTCCVCNRSISSGEIILWNKEHSLVQHLPEVCQFLGTRKKRKSTRADGTNPRAKGTNPKAVEEARLQKQIEQYRFPVEVSYVK